VCVENLKGGELTKWTRAQMFADIVRFQKLALTGLDDLDKPFDSSPRVSGVRGRDGVWMLLCALRRVCNALIYTHQRAETARGPARGRLRRPGTLA
jgi:hypothetical protein